MATTTTTHTSTMLHEIGETRYTDAGEYLLLVQVNDEGYGDTCLRLYVGRHVTLGHCDLIASDDACCWVVGDADNAERNHDQWSVVDDHGLDFEAVRAVDPTLADWLAARKAESDGYSIGD